MCYDMNKKMKVLWLCNYSDPKLRAHLRYPQLYWENIIKRLSGAKCATDYAVWVTNAITEFEKLSPDIELHIVSPQGGINRLHEFVENGIWYHIFPQAFDVAKEKIKRKLNLRTEKSFKRNRRIIAKIVNKVRPDVVHAIGIENFCQSMAIFDIPEEIPVIAQLQTLINDPRFGNNCGWSQSEYDFSCKMESLLLQRADYIGAAASYRTIITNQIKTNAEFVNTSIAVTEPVNYDNCNPEFTFVYFSADISKAFDLAIEAFALTYQKHPNITLDVIGGYSDDFKSRIDARIAELGIGDAIRFEGKLPTHEDVISQIRKSRFALLPLKIDIVSGTIREAMANGLPVVTTITPGTPKLNQNGLAVLLSEVGNHHAMAMNMCNLIDNPQLAKCLTENAFKIALCRKQNSEVVAEWINIYEKIVK